MLEDLSAGTESVQVNINRAELRQAIRHDCVTFFAFYLGEELTMEVPEFHQEIWEELLQLVEQVKQAGLIARLQKLFAVPREHAKSTIAKLATILFLRYSPLRFCLYTSKTVGHAKNAIRDILIWLDSPQERQLYGQMITVKSSETEALWIVKIAVPVPNSTQPEYKTIIFKALGADTQVRGLLILNIRPDFIVVDDIEDNDNTTQDLQPKLDEWFFGPFLKAFARRAFVLYIGNMIRKTTILARLAREPEWNPTVFGALVKNKMTGEIQPLWKGRHTADSLLREYRMYRKNGVGHIWEAEMMNLTQDDIFSDKMENVVVIPMPNPERLTAGFLALDPAFGEDSWHDDAAITVHVRLSDMTIPILIDSWVGKGNEEFLFDKMLELSYKWGISTWCIESVAAQKLLISVFRLLMMNRLMNTEAILMLPVSTGGKSKGSRIIAQRNAFNDGSYGITDSQEALIDKFRVYDPSVKKPDDHVDSAAYGVIGWQFHGEEISARGITEVGLLIFNRESDGSEALWGARVSGV